MQRVFSCYHDNEGVCEASDVNDSRATSVIFVVQKGMC